MTTELQVGVKVLLKNPEGKFLVMRRSPEKYPESPLRWDIPGGRIDAGTTLMANLLREVHEETGLSLDGGAKLIAAQDILKNVGKHVVRLTYEGTAEGEPTLSDEHVEYRWVSVEELEQLAELDRFVKELLDDGYIT